MKRFLSCLISISLLSSMAVIPAHADDVTDEGYIHEEVSDTQSRFGPHSANEAKTHAYEPFAELEEKDTRFEQPYAENTVVFKRREGGVSLFGTDETDDLLAELGAETEVVRRDEQEGISLFGADEEVTYKAVISNGTVPEAVEKLEAMEDVIYAEPDYLFYADSVGLPDETTDIGAVQQWYTFANDPGIRPAWEYLKNNGFSYGGRSDTTVAVIDTGVDYTHEDLANNMWVNLAELNGTPGVDDDGNGYTDDIYGASTVGSKYEHNGNPMDDHGHGTHVAGIIGMTALNGKGGIGVAPGSRIMAIKAGQASGVFSSTDIAEAIDYAAAMGADVINMSFGSYASSSLIEDSLSNAFGSCVLVAAAGNDGYSTNPAPDMLKPQPVYPASYKYVLGVMAYDQSFRLADFSNWDYMPNDAEEYEVIAPGVDIYSTLPGNRYAKWSGTSMAAPMVAGAAALLRSQFSDKSVYSSRFIMGQIASASTQRLVYADKLGGAHSFTKLSIRESLENLPKPNITYAEHYLFDTKDIDEGNDLDGIIDAGETTDLAVVLRNQWGKADNVTLTVDAKSPAGIDNPYVTFINDTVEYGAIGTFNEDDNGLIRNDAGKITGVENPIRFTVSPDTPNDTMITLNLHVTAENGYDVSDRTEYTYDTSINVMVQKGRELKGVISEDMTLTKDDYWIITNATLIPEGVTVDVEPGTQIQFWSSDPEGPYDDKAMAYLKVEGTLNVNGTEEEPVEMFPSLAFEYYGCEVFSSDIIAADAYRFPIGNVSMEYTSVINPRFNIEEGSHIRAVQNYDHVYYREINGSDVNTYDFHGSIMSCSSLRNSSIKNFRGEYLHICGYANGSFTNVLFDNCKNKYLSSSSYNSSVFLENTAKTQTGRYTSITNIYTDAGITSSELIYSDIAEYDGKKYVGLYVPIDWYGGSYNDIYDFAVSFAKGNGGYPASLNSAEEQKFLYENFGGGYIGLTKNDDGSLSWASGEPVDYLPAQSGSGDAGAYIRSSDIYWSPYYTKTSNYGITSKFFILEFPDSIPDENIIPEGELGRYGSHFVNNAVLNRLIVPDTSLWLRITAPSDNVYKYNYINNYWGTTDADLVNAQIVDFDDYMTLGDIIVEPYLTEPPEDCYPFVTNVEVFDSEGNKITEAGAQEITVKVSFNRDMDMNIQPTVSFGSDDPWTDFIISGDWTDARTWTGTYRVTPMTGDGMMYFRVIGAAAADDTWLVTGDDWGRFAVEVVTSGAEALTLQASGGENKVNLQWVQDDYDTLAGYNLYRSKTPDGAYTKINTSLIPYDVKEYEDTNVEPGVVYYYKFTVIDTAMNESDFSNIAQAAPVDNIKPQIAHTPVTSATLNAPIQVSADVTDNIGVNLVELHYRTSGGEWKTLNMNLTSNNRYIVTIPAGDVTENIEYYIEATDGTSWAREGSDSIPYLISVSNAPIIYSVSPGSITADSGTRIYLTGTNFAEGIKIYVGGKEAGNVEFHDATSVSATAPENPVGVYDIKVENPDGQTSVLLRAVSYVNGGLIMQIQSDIGSAGQSVSVPVVVENSGSISSAEFTFTYNPSYLTLESVEKSLSAADFVMEYNDTSGTANVNMAAADAVSGNIPLVYLNFRINSDVSFEQTSLELSAAKVNDIDVTALVDGSIDYVNNYSVSGTVSYYSNGNAVSNVTVQAAAQKTAATDNSGKYTVAKLLPGSYTLTPEKTDEQLGITAYDASLILKYGVGTATLNANQLIAGDVNGSGEVNAADAAAILQMAVGKTNGAFAGSDKVWTFSPASRSVTVSDSDIYYQNFSAILLGDVSGNWNTASLQMLDAVGTKYVTVPSGSTTAKVPVYLNTDKTGSAIDMTIVFSDNVSAATAVLPEAMQGFVMDQNFSGNTLNIAIAGAETVSFGENPVLELNITAAEPITKDNMITINMQSVAVNEEIVTDTDNIIVLSDDAQSEMVDPIGKYIGKVKVTRFANKFTVTSLDTGFVDLNNIRLFLAEYDERGMLTSVKSGAVQISDNVLTLISDLPLSDNYKLLLWDSNQTPITDVITK